MAKPAAQAEAKKPEITAPVVGKDAPSTTAPVPPKDAPKQAQVEKVEAKADATKVVAPPAVQEQKQPVAAPPVPQPQKEEKKEEEVKQIDSSAKPVSPHPA